MEQRITWMHFLIFGISLIILSGCGNDCNCVDGSKEYLYQNSTTHSLEISSYDNSGQFISTHYLEELDTLILLGRVPFDYFELLDNDVIADSLVLVFDNEKKLSISRNSEDDIFNENKYETIENGKFFKIGDSYYERSE